MNLFAVIALRQLAGLEKYAGTEEHGRRSAMLADRILESVRRHYWDEARGLYANDFARKYYSEHAQSLALIIEPDSRLAETFSRVSGLAECSIYFSFYYLDACYRNQLAGLFFKRLERYFDLEKEGLRTLPRSSAIRVLTVMRGVPMSFITISHPFSESARLLSADGRLKFLPDERPIVFCRGEIAGAAVMCGKHPQSRTAALPAPVPRVGTFFHSRETIADVFPPDASSVMLNVAVPASRFRGMLIFFSSSPFSSVAA